MGVTPQIAAWVTFTWVVVALPACGGDPGGGPAADAGVTDDAAVSDAAAPDDAGEASQDAGVDAGGDGGAGDGASLDATAADAADGPPAFVAVTFNVGLHPTVGSNGFTAQMDEYLADYYGHGLSWGPAIAQAQAFFAAVQPDLVTFQETFYTEECGDIPEEARIGFVCEGWVSGAPTVEEQILGPGYQVVCHVNKTDECAAVKQTFGSFRGCAEPRCLEGLFGTPIAGCGSGARVGRGVIDLVDGGSITLVSFHGSSGASGDDIDCRVAQVEQVFVDIGDAEAGANGDVSLVMGDFNTDPRHLVTLLADNSAQRWADFVGLGEDFHYINPHVVTYPLNGPLVAIDNVVSNALTGSCWHPGITDGHPTVSPEGHFDHTPVVCTIPLP